MIEYEIEYKYGDMCQALDVPKLRGSYQKTQLKQISRKYDFEKTPRKTYIFHKKYNDVELIEQQTYFKNKTYIEPMIYTLLYNSETNIIRFDMKTLMLILAIVNKDYHYAKWHIDKVDKKLTGASMSGLQVFMRETEPMYKRIIKDVLKDMQRKNLIKVREIEMFAKVYIAENGKKYTTTYEADDEKDIPKFIEGKRLYAKKCGTEYWDELNYFQLIDGKNFVSDYVGIDYFYYDYELILNKVGIKEMIRDDYIELRKSFNKYIQDKTLKSKSKGMKQLTSEEKDIYVDALINIDNDYKIRFKE